MALALTGAAGSASAQTTTGQLEVAWDANVEPDLSGYRLFVHTDASIFLPPSTPAQAAAVANRVINLTSATTSQIVTNLDATRTWYFAVTAIDVSGNESGFSNVISGQPSVTPTVSSASPSSAVQGTNSLTVRISGGNFLPGCTVGFGPGITVNSLDTSGAPTSLTANITVSSIARANARDVIVTNPGGAAGARTGGFTVSVLVSRLDGDLSGRIDNGDLVGILLGFPSVAGDAKYNTGRDLDVDGKVDGADLAIFFTYFGLVAPYP